MMRGGRTVALAAVFLGAACGTDVRSGVVSVSLAGQTPARAVMFRVVGPHSGIAVPAGQPFRMFPSSTVGDTVTIAVIANQGHTLSGALVSVQVSDVRVMPKVSLIQVAAADYQLQPTISYSLTIAP